MASALNSGQTGTGFHPECSAGITRKFKQQASPIPAGGVFRRGGHRDALFCASRTRFVGALANIECPFAAFETAQTTGNRKGKGSGALQNLPGEPLIVPSKWNQGGPG